MLKRLRNRLRDSRGFSLVEVLVAMVTGIIVVGALFAILEESTRQTSRLSDVAQATQVGNVAMTHIVDELHSTCLSAGFTPVQEGSTPSKLILVNGYFPSKTKEPEYTFVRKDTIEYVSSKEQLNDTWVKATAEPESGVYKTWSTTTSKALLAEKVTQNSVEQPVFTYYKYAAAASSSTEAAAATLKAYKPEEIASGGLTSEQAKSVAAVGVSFTTSPYKEEVKFSTSAKKGLPNELNTLTTFAFSAPNSETEIKAGPCE